MDRQRYDGKTPTSDSPADQMKDRAGEMREQAEGAASEAAERAGQVAGDMAGEARTKADEAADMGRERAAEGMERTASMLREREQDGAVGAVAGRAAEGMERSASYIRQHDTAEMWTDVEHYVREHPVQGIAGAMAAGFLVGRILR